jgi:methyl-accepting chemotaxis protein
MNQPRPRRAIKQTSITVGAAGVVVVLAGLMGFSIVYSSNAVDAERAATTEQAQFNAMGRQVGDSSKLLTNEVRAYATSLDASHLDAYWGEIDTTKSQQKALDRLKELGASADDLAFVEQAAANSASLVDTETRAQRLVLEALGADVSAYPAVAGYELSAADKALSTDEKIETARSILYDDEYAASVVDIMGPLNEFTEALSKHAAAAVADARSEADFAAKLQIGVAILMALAMVGLLWVFHSVLGRVVTRFTTALAERDPKDLRFRLEPAGVQGLHDLAGAFNAQSAQIARLIGAIGTNAAALAGSSEQLSETAHRLGTTAEETSTQASSVSAATEQVSTNVTMVAAGAEQMGASIAEISQSVHAVTRVAASARETAEEMTSVVSELDGSSGEISSVVDVITKIAAQTHLLALNAMIESARAGEFGKGFAVVASEVKELAEQTATATADITEKVAAIQADSRAATTGIDKINHVIREVNDAQVAIAAAIEEQSATTNEMTRSVNEVARGSDEISANITGVATAARNTSSDASSTLTAADDLAKTAENLRTLVDEYQV